MVLTARMLPPLLARIHAEERLLRTQFGDTYDAYCTRTSRLIPGLYEHDASPGIRSSEALSVRRGGSCRTNHLFLLSYPARGIPGPKKARGHLVWNARMYHRPALPRPQRLCAAPRHS